MAAGSKNNGSCINTLFRSSPRMLIHSCLSGPRGELDGETHCETTPLYPGEREPRLTSTI
jgi:hypothetical protein